MTLTEAPIIVPSKGEISNTKFKYCEGCKFEYNYILANLSVIKESNYLEIKTDIDKVKEQIIEMLSLKLYVFLEDDLDEDWSKRWTNLCIHNEKEIMLESNNEELLFMGINHDGQLIGKNKDDKILFVNESSISF